ncbi:MAG TPA: glycosyltransferase family 39 protein, partial [Patescibacteria group bacterium]
MNEKWLHRLILTAIFLLAIFLRADNLSKIPNSLHQDELNAGYQGYKIIHTGRDLQGNFLPLYINRFGDFRPAGIFYLDGISTSILGLNTFSVRLPAALFGAFTIFPVYLLAFAISKKKYIGYLAGLLIAISPWHIVASRSTSEQIVALFLIILGAWLMIKGLEEKKIKWFVYSVINFLLSYFFYHTPRVFVPGFLTLFVGLIFFHPLFVQLKKNKVTKSISITLWAVMCLATILLTFTKFGVGRFDQTSIFASQGTLDKIKALSDVDQNVTTARIFHNKAVVYTKVFLDQYLSYFSTDFLFVKGGLPDRYVVPDMGLFYYIEFPLMLLGFYFLLRKKDLFFMIPIIWLLVGPIASALTTEDIPNIQRALFMLPGFQILEAYGIYYTFKLTMGIWRKLFIIILVLAFLLNIIYFFHQYFVHSPSYVSYRRDDGTEELFQNLANKDKSYSAIYLSSYQDLPLYYYYLHPQNVTFPTYNQKNIDKGMRVGKYIFVPDECP